MVLGLCKKCLHRLLPRSWIKRGLILSVVALLIAGGFALLRGDSNGFVEIEGVFFDSGVWTEDQGRVTKYLFLDGDDGKRYWVRYAGDEVWVILDCLRSGDHIEGMIGERSETKTSEMRTPTGDFEMYDSQIPSDYVLAVVNITISPELLFERLDAMDANQRKTVLRRLDTENPSGTADLVSRYGRRGSKPTSSPESD